MGYRTSGDVRANFGSVMGNLHSVTKFSIRNLSYPGCWAYPDMLEVGCASDSSGLNAAETRTHFGAWVIVSSPLTLSHDVNNDTIMDRIWPVISNKEAIAVSQTFAGFSGGPFHTSSNPVVLDEVNPSKMTKYMTEDERKATGPMVAASFEYFYKPLDYANTSAAVLLINTDAATQELKLNFADVPNIKGPCKVRDIWNHKDLGNADESMTFSVGTHDSAFLKLTDCTPAPEPPKTLSALVNPSSGKCLDIVESSYPQDESQAELFTCSGTDNQKWMLQGKALVNIASGKCLDINNHNMKQPSEIPDETKVELYSCNGLWNQQWELKNGRLVNTPSGKCLDIYGGSVSPKFPADGSKAQLFTCSGGKANQGWELSSTSVSVVV